MWDAPWVRDPFTHVGAKLAKMSEASCEVSPGPARMTTPWPEPGTRKGLAGCLGPVRVGLHRTRDGAGAISDSHSNQIPQRVIATTRSSQAASEHSFLSLSLNMLGKSAPSLRPGLLRLHTSTRP